MRSLAPSFVGRTEGKRVPVYLADGVIDHLGEILRGASQGRSSARRQVVEVVTDQNVDHLLGRRVRSVLRRAGWSVNLTVLPAGERIKSGGTVSKLHNRWFEPGYDRQTPVIALGGGTVGDVVGFAAATFMRGLPFWQIPTTIVAQVDAAIGGKVGINHSRGKNLIGCFYQPSGIIIDPSVLATLPLRERRSGLAEVVKYGVIADQRLFHTCERCLKGWIDGAGMIPSQVIRRCVRIKLRVVAADETDHGVRQTLNFGHTLGHALERWGNFRRLRHGEAVALGMIGAGWMAFKRNLWTRDEFERLSLLCRHLRPRRLPAFRPGEVSVHLSVDKKRVGGRNVWILPRSIGRVDYFDDVTDREISGALAHIVGWLKE
jgi:3-dehydroquinate synthase